MPVVTAHHPDGERIPRPQRAPLSISPVPAERLRAAPLGRPRYVTRLVRGPRALAALAPGWRELQEQVPSAPMLRLEWAQAYADTFGARDPDCPWVVAVEVEGQLAAVAPMIHRRSLRVPRLESLGVKELFEPTDLLYRDPAALRALITGLLQTRLPLFLERQPSGSATMDQLERAARGRALVIRRPRPGSPSVVLGGDPERLLNAGRRSDLRRARRRAEQHGAVLTEVRAPARAELPGLLAAAFEIEAAGWKGAASSALLNERATRAFFERYAALAADAGILRLALLRAGGRPIAMHLDVECGGALWLLKIGYDEAFASCSPGNLLMMDVLRYAASRGLKTCEFLGKAEPWTQAWTHQECGSECVMIYSLSLPSAACLALRAAGALRRRLAALGARGAGGDSATERPSDPALCRRATAGTSPASLRRGSPSSPHER